MALMPTEQKHTCVTKTHTVIISNPVLGDITTEACIMNLHSLLDIVHRHRASTVDPNMELGPYLVSIPK